MSFNFDRRTFLKGAGAVGAASLLAACGEKSNNTGNGAAASGAAAPNSTGATPLKEFISFESGNRELESWNMLYTQKAEDANVVTNLWDGLLSFDCYGKVVPAIASSWEHNEDATVWTFHLRDDVDWVDCNGEVKAHLTSNDFLVGFEWVMNAIKNEANNTSMPNDTIVGAYEYYALTKEAGDAAADMTYEDMLAAGVGIEAPDDYTLVFTCPSACPYFDTVAAYNSFYPLLLPEGQEERAYTVSAMLYPILKVLMMPLAALLYDTLGVGRLLLIQGALSVLAALIENRIHVQESRRDQEPLLSLKTWWRDIREAAAYLRQEHGLHGLYEYMAVTNGMAMGYSPLLIAFFRTAPGFTTAMYSFFSVAEFAGRTIGGAVRYRYSLPERKRFGFLFGVYQTYELMDACLLWLPYPLMLVNRALCGFLGIQSATIRQAAVQRYIPDRLRARLNAYESLLCTAAGAVLSLAIGALGEVLDYRLCMTICGLTTMLVCWLTVFLRRRQVQQVLASRPNAAQPGVPQ